MARSSDVLIGLHAELSAVCAAAFDRDGQQLGIANAPAAPIQLPEGGLEQDMTDTWHAAAGAVRLLAQRVPDLARRTVALAVTGHAGGTWLIDEDGDPVAAALLWPDHRAAPVVEAWQRSGVASAVAEITGTTLAASLQSAQLAWLQERRPQLVDAAASVLHTKDWLYFCCTGERVTDAAEAGAAYGTWRTGRYDGRVLELLGLADAARLLPEIVDATRHQGALLPAAAAATGLYEGTPVVLAPPDAVSAALATGLQTAAGSCGCSVLGPDAVHIRWQPQKSELAVPAGSIVPVAGHGFLALVRRPAGTHQFEWPAGLGEQLLADLGLIGISRGDLAAVLEQKAGEARPGAVLFRPPAGPSRPGELSGLSGGTSLYDLLRAIYEAVGCAARDGYEALGCRPTEVRLTGAEAGRPVLREIVGACVGAPTRRLLREDAAARGAACFAAVSLGQYRSMAESAGSWVEPHLEAAEPPDPQLCSVYDLLLELRRRPRA